MRTLRETYTNLIYVGSTLGAWGPWESIEGEGKRREGIEQRKMYSSIKSIKINKKENMDQDYELNTKYYISTNAKELYGNYKGKLEMST